MTQGVKAANDEERRVADRARRQRYEERHPGRMKDAQHRWYANGGREKRRAYQTPERARAARYKAKFGITVEEYDAMLVIQGGGCAACGGPSGRRRFHVDHDHETGRVRGLLCHGCNVALGLLRDDPVRILALKTYIEKVAA